MSRTFFTLKLRKLKQNNKAVPKSKRRCVALYLRLSLSICSSIFLCCFRFWFSSSSIFLLKHANDGIWPVSNQPTNYIEMIEMMIFHDDIDDTTTDQQICCLIDWLRAIYLLLYVRIVVVVDVVCFVLIDVYLLLV